MAITNEQGPEWPNEEQSEAMHLANRRIIRRLHLAELRKNKKAYGHTKAIIRDVIGAANGDTLALALMVKELAEDLERLEP